MSGAVTDDEVERGWTGCGLVVLAVGMAVASLFVDSLVLPLIAVPVAATGSGIGYFARGSTAGRLASGGGLAAVVLTLAAVAIAYGRAMAGLGLGG